MYSNMKVRSFTTSYYQFQTVILFDSLSDQMVRKDFAMDTTASEIKTAAQLESIIDPAKKYSRQEVARIVGCIWANVLDASRGQNPKLRGELVGSGNGTQWMFTGAEVLRWRRDVEARRPGSNSGLRVTLVLADMDQMKRLRDILAGTEFDGRV